MGSISDTLLSLMGADDKVARMEAMGKGARIEKKEVESQKQKTLKKQLRRCASAVQLRAWDANQTIN
jgi:hypothetical protein